MRNSAKHTPKVVATVTLPLAARAANGTVGGKCDLTKLLSFRMMNLKLKKSLNQKCAQAMLKQTKLFATH